METIILAFGASTLALVILPLVDYLLDEETVIKRKMMMPHARPPSGAASDPVLQVRYDWAA